MILSDFLTEVRVLTVDASDNRWALTVKTKYLNDGQEAIVKRANLFENVASLGVAGPVAAPVAVNGGSGLPRSYQYTYAIMAGGVLVSETLPSPAVAVTKATGAQLTFGALPTGYTHIRVYANDPATGAGLLYLVATQTGTTFTDTAPLAGLLVPLVSQYTVPVASDGTTACAQVNRVELGGREIIRKNTNYFNNRVTNWRNDTGTPNYYIPSTFGLNVLRFYPFDITAESDLVLFYNQRPTLLVNTTDLCALPPAYHMALVYYTVMMCYLRDIQQKDPAKAKIFGELYEAELSQLLMDKPSYGDSFPYRYV